MFNVRSSNDITCNDLICIACRTINFDVGKLNLVGLLKEYNLTINDISSEIYSIVKSNYDSNIHYNSLIIDIENMRQYSEDNYDLEVYLGELVVIVLDIKTRVKQFSIQGHELIGIEFKEPDTIHLLYV